MPAISVAKLCWATPEGRTIFDDLNLSFGNQRVGIVGRNGVGKSTLLHILAGDLEPADGSIHADGTIALLRQSVKPRPNDTIADLFGAAEALEVLTRAESGLASMEDLAEADWTVEERIAEALVRVELEAGATTRLASLSGGQQTRAALAAAIFADPDFLLFDEPTNNLDRDGRDAVLRLVEGWTKGLVIVSHDRELLERMDAIIEMTTLGAVRYGGNWSHYRERKAIELAAAESDLIFAQKRQADIHRRTRQADERKAKRDAAGARKSLRGDMPKILLGARKNAAESSGGSGQRLNERMASDAADAVAAARARVEILQKISIKLPSTKVSDGRKLVALSNVAGGYDPDKPAFARFSLVLRSPERVAISGFNGAGKSTLLKIIAGELDPLSGSVDVPAQARLIDQHVAFLDRTQSILDNFKRLNPESDENACRSILAGFLFRADAALQQVGTLSGGQLLRAGLACRLGGPHPPELLLLDEPTNHLDLDSISAIEDALLAYDGGLIVVSHDRHFLEKIGITRQVSMTAKI
ncbi:ABC-F family ATP-binding cassette domain-containing protein [Sphingopyxis terrae]|uniref:ATPase components of ABC transporters with duplicated ATPase domains n=1 Tax=Sphingopyxis terrae subsp. ummariensis TaxID=429001 RepID=A0A1Y6FP21_9SPHN|nr:ABC-F family ATP-binding cassette domain-containing protein [Sphingopyxis terrae]PCF90932.1 ABC transporter [Sphingopyxis terrae subsp. ummariensis]SMQ76457.1 ATPase components of ABC transporters with duplicated ATPase domains [Sphingopyxis terrae subsp. ummariensis]